MCVSLVVLSFTRFVFLLLFFDSSKNIAEIDPHKRAKDRRRHRARDAIRRTFVFSSSKRKIKERRRRRLQKVRAHRFRRHRRHRDRRDERCFRQNVAAIDIIDFDSFITVVLFLLLFSRR